MGDKPFIKFYPSDFLAGTSGLSPAERGVYITLLCLIYETDGQVPRDDARLSRRCGAPKAAFKRTLDALIDEGKITERAGMLSNERAEKVIVDRQNRIQNATHAAQQKWDAQRKKTEQNQRPDDAGAMPSQCPADANQNQSQIEAKASLAKKRGTRLPDDWFLPMEWGQWAVKEGYAHDQIKVEADKFKDYWHGVPGSKGVKLDWLATWRNWMRNSQQKAGGKYGNANSSGQHAQGRQDGADPALEQIARLAGLR